MATTTNGWPYVVPADHPLEYPAVSQQLATFADTKVTPLLTTSSAITNWGSGWSDSGSPDGPATVIRQGRAVTVSAVCKRTADLVIALNTAYLVCTLPAGFVPLFHTNIVGMFVTNTSPGTTVVRLRVMNGGQVNAYFGAAFTLATNQFITFNGSFVSP